MFRIWTLLVFAVAALGQVPQQAARVSIQATADGTVRGTLTVPIATLPEGLPEAFARAIGCGIDGLATSHADYEVVARCPATRPSPLNFRATIRLYELAPRLLEAGAGRVDLTLITPSSFRVDPVIAPQDSELGSQSYAYQQAQYSLDQLPGQFTVEGGFETGQVRALGWAALGWILIPFLLLLLRPSDPLRLRVQVEGIFVFGWITWIWVLSRVDAGPLLAYLFAGWTLGPMLALLAPPLAAVWIGSRLAARQVARFRTADIGADYRRMRFWSGAAATCLASTLLHVLLSTFTETPWTSMLGVALTAACVLRIRRLGRGKSHALSQGELRNRAFELAARAGVTLRGVSIVTAPTPRPPFAVATRWGIVVMNDSLLTQLSRREVDAIMCHELSHLRPGNRSAHAVLYVLIVAAFLASQWIPHFSNAIPILLIAAYFLVKAWRRAGERKADRDAVRWSGDPEAMLTGLARVTQANSMPLDWGAPISWMMGHPPTMDRLRAIARAGGLRDGRIAELIEESRQPAVHHYGEAQAFRLSQAIHQAIPEDAAFSPAMRQRLTQRLTWYVLAGPVWGFPAVWLFERFGLAWWAVFLAASVFSAAVIYAGSDWITASNRRLVKQRALVRHGPGLFAGFSPSAEPRVFDGQYHYDVGMVRFVNGVLEFVGDRARFTLDRRLVERVWLGDGPRHWMPRKVVYIECRPLPEAAPVIFSLQPFEAWIWPATVRVARRLYQEVDEWHNGLRALPAPSPAPPLPSALPRVEGSASPFISFRTAFRSVALYSGIAFFLVSMEITFQGLGRFSDLSQMLCPVAVCGLLAFVVVAPRLNWGRLTTFTGSQTRLPAGS